MNIGKPTGYKSANRVAVLLKTNMNKHINNIMWNNIDRDINFVVWQEIAREIYFQAWNEKQYI